MSASLPPILCVDQRFLVREILACLQNDGTQLCETGSHSVQIGKHLSNGPFTFAVIAMHGFTRRAGEDERIAALICNNQPLVVPRLNRFAGQSIPAVPRLKLPKC